MLPFNSITEMAMIYYEGNLYDAMNLNTYEERIACAAGRAHTRYPTIARSAIFKEDLQDFNIIGRCDPIDHYKIEFYRGCENIISEWTES